jgi:hypothetical protein
MYLGLSFKQVVQTPFNIFAPKSPERIFSFADFEAPRQPTAFGSS